MSPNPNKKISRREFLKTVLFTSGAAALAGCTGSRSGTTPTASVRAAAPTELTGAVELVHWDWSDDFAAYYDQEARLFESRYPHIKVRFQAVDGSRFNDLFQAGLRDPALAPDTFPITQIQLQDMAANGWLADWAQFTDFENFKAQFPKPNIDFYEGVNVIGGAVYSAPREARTGMDAFLYSNRSLLKQAGGLDVPEELDAFLEACRAIKQQTGAYPFAFSAASATAGLLLWAVQFSGVSAADSALNLKTAAYNLNSPGTKKVLETLQIMASEGLILPDSQTFTDEKIMALFAESKVAFIANGPWLPQAFHQSHPNFTQYTASHLPFALPADPHSYWPASPGGVAYGLHPKSKAPAAAWEWIKWLYSPAAVERWLKSGRGSSSIWPDSNKPEYFLNDAQYQTVLQSVKYTRVSPQPFIRSPDTARVRMASASPDMTAIFLGVYSGEIRDFETVLAEYDRQMDANLNAAINDAAASGLQVKRQDYLFKDWDKTKDYLPAAEYETSSL